jgi:hypothetical protein
MVDDPSLSFIGLEYFANRGDELWRMADEDLLALGASEAHAIGLFEPADVRDGLVVRMPRAYPVYDGAYEAHVQVLRAWLDRFDNLFTVGRNGQHRYNNQDHSMLTGLYAARNVAGAGLDVWSINEELSFHEEVRTDEASGARVRDRMTPSPVQAGLEQLLRDAFAVYDEVAMGGAVGIVASLGLLLVTGALLLGVTEGFVPMLSLLGQYLFGYRVSWPGLAVGMIEAGLLGFSLGWAGARLSNLLITVAGRNLERRLATLTTLEALDGGFVDRR